MDTLFDNFSKIDIKRDGGYIWGTAYDVLDNDLYDELNNKFPIEMVLSNNSIGKQNRESQGNRLHIHSIYNNMENIPKIWQDFIRLHIDNDQYKRLYTDHAEHYVDEMYPNLKFDDINSIGFRNRGRSSDVIRMVVEKTQIFTNNSDEKIFKSIFDYYDNLGIDDGGDYIAFRFNDLVQLNEFISKLKKTGTKWGYRLDDGLELQGEHKKIERVVGGLQYTKKDYKKFLNEPELSIGFQLVVCSNHKTEDWRILGLHTDNSKTLFNYLFYFKDDDEEDDGGFEFHKFKNGKKSYETRTRPTFGTTELMHTFDLKGNQLGFFVNNEYSIHAPQIRKAGHKIRKYIAISGHTTQILHHTL
jgi:hypothetical protein